MTEPTQLLMSVGTCGLLDVVFCLASNIYHQLKSKVANKPTEEGSVTYAVHWIFFTLKFRLSFSLLSVNLFAFK